MERKPISIKNAVAIILLGVILFPTAYISGYFLLGDYHVDSSTSEKVSWVGSLAIVDRGPFVEREFGYQWIARAYSPLAWVESLWTGATVKTKSKRS